MEVTDVRIGNLVFGYKTVWSIDSTDFYNISIIETYKPIPLTEEWLLKCGFEKYYIGDIECYRDNKIVNRFSIAISGRKCYKYLIGSYGVGINIKYVHQLQNLYYALTGQELKTLLAP